MSNILKNQNSSKQIKLGALISYVTIGFNILSGLIYTPWLISQIGQSDFGLYTLSVSLIGFIAIDFGLGSAVARFLSRYKAEGNKQGEKRFLGVTFKLYISISAIIFAVLFIVYFFIENIYIELSWSEIEKLKILYVISGLFTVVSFSFKPFEGILISNERFIFIKLVDLLYRILTVTLMIAALLLDYGLYAIVIVNAFVGLLKIIIQYLYIKRKTDTEIQICYQEKSLYREIFSFSAWTTIIAISQGFILNITPTILGAVAGSVQIAIFSVGMIIEGYTYTLASALGGLFLPKVTRMISNQNSNMNAIEELNIKVGRIQLLILGIIIISFVSMGREFIYLWIGNDFSDSYYVALLLILPCIVTLTYQIASTTLIAMNKIKYGAFASIITAVTSIILSLFLSSYYGAIGSAFAIFIGNIIGSLIFANIVYHKVLKINVFRFFKECHLKMLIPIILTLIIGFVIQHFFPVKILVYFVVKGIVLCIIYFTLMWIISFNQNEKKLFISKFKNK